MKCEVLVMNQRRLKSVTENKKDYKARKRPNGTCVSIVRDASVMKDKNGVTLSDENTRNQNHNET